MMIYASVVHAVPDTQTRVFTDEGCAVIAFTDGGAAVDLSGSSYTVRSLAARNGVYPTAVFCKDSMADEYKDIFPGAKIYDCDIYADYTVNGIPLHIDSGGAVIDTGETTVIHR